MCRTHPVAVKMTPETHAQGMNTFPRRELVCFRSHDILFRVFVNLEIGLDVRRCNFGLQANVILTSSHYDD